MNPTRCINCGKFLPRSDYITYTEFSLASEFTPRDPKFLCVNCYEKSDKELLDKISWLKPYKVLKEEPNG